MKEDELVRIFDVATTAVPSGVRATSLEQDVIFLVIAVEDGHALVPPRFVVPLV
jgi:hypothetical protein